jgi:DNA primase
MIDNASVEQLKNNIDIVDIISNYIEIKKSGANFKANCPFHGEKTPSFVISPAKQIFHCFGCLSPSEEVRTVYGLREIQDIKVGDKVFTFSGKATEVIETVNHKPQYKMLKFKTDLMNDWSTFTANHDMLIVSKEEALKQLPYIGIEENKSQKFYGVIKKQRNFKPITIKSEISFAQDVNRGDYFLYPVEREILDIKKIDLGTFLEKKRSNSTLFLLNSVDINLELMWLFGLYIAGGTTYNGGIKFSLHANQFNYAKRVIEILKKSFSIDESLCYSKIRESALEVGCSSPNLEYIFMGLFSKVENRCYPYYFNYLKKEYRELFLHGLMDGAGCYRSNSYTTISRTLAYSLVDLAIGLETIPTLYIYDSSKNKNGVNNKKSYKILFRKRESLKSFFEYIYGVKYLFMRVKEIKDADKEELVYDITVKDSSHIFLTKSFLVGNCGVGGDAIKFVQEYEKLNYPESLEKIASMINFSLAYTKGTNDNSETRRVLEQVQSWYSRTLDEVVVAKKYLQDRGINQHSIEKFGVGYVGKSHESLNFLSATFLPLPKAQEGGIIDSRERGGYYARLTERITFPIYSASGAIVGFGGRTITNHPAKYINSPQTKLFNKSQLLYGYSKAKESIYKNKELIICEGYLDVIMFHQAGFTGSVATLGTALTDEHLPLLRKGEPDIILAYDGDKAGIAAALKASIMLTKNGFNGSVVLFPDGKDPADMLSTGKVQEVANLLRSGQILIPFVLDMMARSYDLKNPHQKEVAFKAFQEYLDKLSPIIRDDYISYASNVLGVRAELFGVSERRLPKVLEQKRIPLNIKINEEKYDLGLLSIIKTLVENRDFINQVINVIESSMFGQYNSLLEAVIQDQENSTLIGLTLDENIKVMSEEELTKSLRLFLFKYYTEQLKKIAIDDSISSIKKSFLMRKIKMDILPRLKRGELVSYKF